MKQIHTFKLRRHTTDTQTCTIPRRAQITGIEVQPTAVLVNAIVEHDEDTKAFDTGRHQRHFSVRIKGDTVPAGSLAAFSEGVHVFEVPAETAGGES